LNLSDELAKAYVRSKIRISHIIAENDMITALCTFCKTIENPREEMLLANFISIWQIDNITHRGYQMSQLS
jgi:hypothetical protein